MSFSFPLLEVIIGIFTECEFALDVHVLRWLHENDVPVPKNFATPTSKKKYLELEQKFLKLADDLHITPRELDYRIWKDGSGDESWSLDETMVDSSDE